MIEPHGGEPCLVRKAADGHAAVLGRLYHPPCSYHIGAVDEHQADQECFQKPHGLLFLLGFENESEEVPAHLKPFQIDFSLSFIKLLYARPELVAPVNKIIELIG